MGNTRRDFLQKVSVASSGLIIRPEQAFNFSVGKESQKKELFAGIQLGTHSLLDEGIEWVLDLMQEKGNINTLITYSHSYYGAFNRSKEVLADHGKGIRSFKGRNLPKVWVRHREEFFKGLLLKHQKPDPKFEYYDRDVFAEIRKPLDERNMKVYFRLFEPWAKDGVGRIENYEKVLTHNIDGSPGRGPCWNNPDYRAWIYATLQDVFTNYQIDGIQYGAERVGPLSELILKGEEPNCFCEFCLKKNMDQGIDPERAKMGFRDISKLMNDAEANNIPVDGVLISLMRIVFEYPEVISWENNFLDGGEQINKGIYETIKSIDSSIQVGRHVDHQQTSWDPIYRAMVPYSKMADHNDFIKPCLYHDILSIRLRHWVIERWHQFFGRDFSENQLLSGFYSMMKFPAEAQIPLDELAANGMPAEYVASETKRCVAGVNGKAKTYVGVGFDVPWHIPGGHQDRFSDPDIIYRSTLAALNSGADGVVASRAYDEIENESLEAFGRAVSDFSNKN